MLGGVGSTEAHGACVGVFRGCWGVTELYGGDRSQLTEKIPQLRD